MKLPEQSRKPNSVFYAYGQTTTDLQNKIFVSAISLFKIQLTNTDLKVMSKREIESLSLERSGETYRIPFDAFTHHFLTDHRFLATLRDECKAMAKMSYSIQSGAHYKHTNLFQEIGFGENGENSIVFQFTQPFILNMISMIDSPGYSTIEIAPYFTIGGNYAGRLYMHLLTAFKSSQQELALPLTVSRNDLLKILGIMDTDENILIKSYETWSIFNRDVLKKAVHEINENPNINMNITYESNQFRRKTSGATFHITRSIEKRSTLGSTNILLDFGISSFMAKAIADQFPDNEFLKYAVEESKKRATSNPQGFLATAIEDLKADYDRQLATNTKAKVTATEKTLKGIKAEKAFREKQEQTIADQLRPVVEEFRNALSEDERSEKINELRKNKQFISYELAELTVAEKWRNDKQNQ